MSLALSPEISAPTPEIDKPSNHGEVPGFAERYRDWEKKYQPGSSLESWFLRLLVVQSLRIDRCQVDEPALRAHVAKRAALLWDEDRALAAEELGGRLETAKRPALTVARLKKTKQGCDWLIDRWHALAASFAKDRAWTEAQQSLALDLLGIRRDERPGDFSEAVPDPLYLANAKIDELERLQARGLDELDRHEREGVEKGLEVGPSRLIDAARRYEASCIKTYRWAGQELARLRRDAGPPIPPVVPVAVAVPEPEHAPPKAASPPPPRPVRDRVAVDSPEDDDRIVFTQKDMDSFRARMSELSARRAAAANAANAPSPVAESPAPQGNRRARKAAERRLRNEAK